MIRTLQPARPLDDIETRVLFNRAKINLTPRELDCVKLVPGGLTNRQIAKRLSITPDTVTHHLRIAMRKMGVRNRVHLAIFAIRANIVPIEAVLFDVDEMKAE